MTQDIPEPSGSDPLSKINQNLTYANTSSNPRLFWPPEEPIGFPEADHALRPS
ncbi:MAG: hypothetical protein UU09_C0040G0012 [Microgenomates group bacterium GW2011_GWA2_40_6]|nr:MAG: hypothetical protein UU09_C0040G0012 [Microgenomates group bacterium GW2011_GWA2_40_6]